MNDRPEVSVVINNFNYASFLAKAIDSALSQEEVALEVIVVDDGSTDNSREILASYGDKIHTVFKSNGGQASAINAGVAVARGEVIVFLDADDWLHPQKCATVLAAHLAAPEAGLIYHRLQPTYSDGREAFRPIPPSLCSGNLAPRLLRSGGRWPYPMTSSLSVRRAVWDDAGEIPDCFRISADAWLTGVLPFLTDVVAIPDALGFYRIHNNSWYREDIDRETLLKRMTHWETTVDVTNRFLEKRGLSGHVSVADNFDYSLAAARLGLSDAPSPLRLIWQGLGDAGEPSLLRRCRDTARALGTLRHPMLEPSTASNHR